MGRNANDMFESKYLKCGDFPNPRVCTMGEVTDEDMTGNGTEIKPVLHFQDAGLKSVVLNRTNTSAIVEVYGTDVDSWRGHTMELYADLNVTNPQGQRVGGIRMRKPDGAAPAPAPAFLLTWPDAQTQAAAVGITKDNLIAALKAQGHTAYNPLRDTPTVQAMIAAKAQPQEESFDAGPPATPAVAAPPDDLIPF